MFQKAKQLPQNSTVKDDLQTLYESVQEIGYTDYAILKTLEYLGTLLEEVRKNLGDHSARMQYCVQDRMVEDGENRREEHHEEMLYLRELGNRIESSLNILEETLNQNKSIDPFNGEAELVLKTARVLLEQNGYDPETGLKKGELERDWSKLKTKVKDVLLSSLILGVAGWVLREYAQHQEARQRELHYQLQEEIKKLKTP
jgi:hypothetical protein